MGKTCLLVWKNMQHAWFERSNKDDLSSLGPVTCVKLFRWSDTTSFLPAYALPSLRIQNQAVAGSWHKAHVDDI